MLLSALFWTIEYQKKSAIFRYGGEGVPPISTKQNDSPPPTPLVKKIR